MMHDLYTLSVLFLFIFIYINIIILHILLHVYISDPSRTIMEDDPYVVHDALIPWNQVNPKHKHPQKSNNSELRHILGKASDSIPPAFR
ncbi:uncharacterized protein BDW43DRAFT_295104 [Aspergillus alliaceus]|uniref:uncharacterized protein n=1 Tax=Petromyces alliaceus TaxID=209559 RepID=UPI0012A5488F|nr:uncharacterized protein BDW43DRAFT_295104 [Aspergillus alliaceus]KAB8227016.1 hypothetical protein BDW43DRAFT_295104 [Aspergillus alliaceus]